MARAKEIIGGMTKEIEIDSMYHGRVVSIKEFGAFVEVFPGKDGLVHVSELADFRVNRTEDIVKIGDMIWVKCIGIDDKGRVKLSRKAALKERGEIETGAPTTGENVEGSGGGEGGGYGRREDRGPRRDRGDRGDRAAADAIADLVAKAAAIAARVSAAAISSRRMAAEQQSAGDQGHGQIATSRRRRQPADLRRLRAFSLGVSASG